MFAGDEAAGEGDHPHVAGGDQGFAQFRAAGGDGDHGFRQAGGDQVRHQFEGRQRCQLGRFEDHRVAASDGRAEFVGDQVQRVVVGGDGDDQAQGFTGEPALARFGAFVGIERYDFTGVALGFFGGELEGVDAAFDFFFRLFEGLAGFVDDQPGEGFGVAFDVQCRVFEDAGAAMTWECGTGACAAAAGLEQVRDF